VGTTGLAGVTGAAGSGAGLWIPRSAVVETFFVLGLATLAVLLPVRLALAGFVLVVFDFAGFFSGLA